MQIVLYRLPKVRTKSNDWWSVFFCHGDEENGESSRILFPIVSERMKELYKSEKKSCNKRKNVGEWKNIGN